MARRKGDAFGIPACCWRESILGVSGKKALMGKRIALVYPTLVST
jgi:hypothetical protein